MDAFPTVDPSLAADVLRSTSGRVAAASRALANMLNDARTDGGGGEAPWRDREGWPAQMPASAGSTPRGPRRARPARPPGFDPADAFGAPPAGAAAVGDDAVDRLAAGLAASLGGDLFAAPDGRWGGDEWSMPLTRGAAPEVALPPPAPGRGAPSHPLPPSEDEFGAAGAFFGPDDDASERGSVRAPSPPRARGPRPLVRAGPEWAGPSLPPPPPQAAATTMRPTNQVGEGRGEGGQAWREDAALAHPSPPRSPRPPQSVVILVGLPGSGTSGAAAVFKGAGWSVVGDADGANARANFGQALSHGQSVVVDRVNSLPDQRAVWIRIAAKRGVPVHAIELRTPLHECERAALESRRPGVSPSTTLREVRQRAGDLKECTHGEGLDTILRPSTPAKAVADARELILAGRRAAAAPATPEPLPLPAALSPPARTSPARKRVEPPPLKAAAAAAAAPPAAPPAAVDFLRNALGLPEAQIVDALAACNGSAAGALDMLLAAGVGDGGGAPAPTASAAAPPSPSAPPAPTQCCVILVGLPGSGASTAVALFRDAGWRVVRADSNQAKSALVQAHACGCSSVIDGVNATPAERAPWIALAQEWGVSVHALELRTPVDACKKAVLASVGTSKIERKQAVRDVELAAATVVECDQSEGFDRVVRAERAEAAATRAASFGRSPPMLTTVRTAVAPPAPAEPAPAFVRPPRAVGSPPRLVYGSPEQPGLRAAPGDFTRLAADDEAAASASSSVDFLCTALGLPEDQVVAALAACHGSEAGALDLLLAQVVAADDAVADDAAPAEAASDPVGRLAEIFPALLRSTLVDALDAAGGDEAAALEALLVGTPSPAPAEKGALLQALFPSADAGSVRQALRDAGGEADAAAALLAARGEEAASAALARRVAVRSLEPSPDREAEEESPADAEPRSPLATAAAAVAAAPADADPADVLLFTAGRRVDLSSASSWAKPGRGGRLVGDGAAQATLPPTPARSLPVPTLLPNPPPDPHALRRLPRVAPGDEAEAGFAPRGATVADPAYGAHRAEAKRLFSEAARCLSAAADARARGDNKAAASAAAKASDLRARGEAANAAARDDIFRRRNAASTSAFHVDLHGLHVAEALDKAVQVLDHALRNPQDPLAGTHVVRVMTGRGTHSGATGAALLPAVHDLLAGCHLRKHVKAESGGGVFAVSLPPPLAARTRAADQLPRAAAAALEKARARRSAL